MIAAVILTFVSLFVPVFSGVLLLRVILSYFMRPESKLMEALASFTEPVLAPIRTILPASGGLDFAPLVAILLLQALQTLVVQLFGQ
jgi:YggT family protein